MSNSTLINHTRLTNNCYKPRTQKISKITIHHMAGVLTVESCGNWFAQSEANASSNYGIDSNGRIGMYVEEKNGSWCSSNYDNDMRAVTIEVSNSVAANPWPVSDKAYNALINLCVDICKRNDIKQLNYTGTATGNLTRHDFYKNKICPGPYLGGKFPEIARLVNSKLTGMVTAPPVTATGYLVRVLVDALNIRTGAGTNYAIVDVIKDKGVYTIIEEKTGLGANKWGWLKSGAGWIAVDPSYVMRI